MTIKPPLLFIHGRCFKVTTYHVDSQGNRTEEPIRLNRVQLERIEKLASEIFKQLPKEHIGAVSKVTSEGIFLGDRAMPFKEITPWTALVKETLDAKEKMGQTDLTPVEAAEELVETVLNGKPSDPHITAPEISLALQQHQNRKAGQTVNVLPTGFALRRAQQYASILGLKQSQEIAALPKNAADEHIPKTVNIPSNIRAQIDEIYKEYHKGTSDTTISETLHKKMQTLLSATFTNAEHLHGYYQLVCMCMGLEPTPNLMTPDGFSNYWKNLRYFGKATDTHQKARYESQMFCLIEALAVFADADGQPLDIQPVPAGAPQETWKKWGLRVAKRTGWQAASLLGRGVWNTGRFVTGGVASWFNNRVQIPQPDVVL